MKKAPELKPIAAGVFENLTKIVRLPDGTLMAFVSRKNDPQRMVFARFSKDNGETWSELEPQFNLMNFPGDLLNVQEAVLDRQGEIHAFTLAEYRPDERGESERGGPGTYGGTR